MLSFVFGGLKPSVKQVFYVSRLCLGFVNLKPVVPGHVLVIPKRRVGRYKDLEDDEILDLWKSSKIISESLEIYHKATGITFVIQDGPNTGQTVEHVHVHIMPRKAGDFIQTDDIYKQIELDRPGRTIVEMEREALEYRKLFPDHQDSSIIYPKD